MGEHVEPPAVGHPEERVTNSLVGRVAQDLVQHGNEHVDAFHRKAGLAGEGLMQEPLEHFDLRQPVEQGLGAMWLHRGKEPPRLGRVAQPVALLRHEHVRVVEPGRRAVDPPQPVNRLKRIARPLGDRSTHERGGQLLKIGVGKAVCRC